MVIDVVSWAGVVVTSFASLWCGVVWCVPCRAVLCCRWQWARALRLGLGLIGVGEHEHGQRMAVSRAVGVRGAAVRNVAAAVGGRAGGGWCLAGGRQYSGWRRRSWVVERRRDGGPLRTRFSLRPGRVDSLGWRADRRWGRMLSYLPALWRALVLMVYFDQGDMDDPKRRSNVRCPSPPSYFRGVVS
jgi:hypothetical protein